MRKELRLLNFIFSCPKTVCHKTFSFPSRKTATNGLRSGTANPNTFEKAHPFLPKIKDKGEAQMFLCLFGSRHRWKTLNMCLGSGRLHVG